MKKRQIILFAIQSALIIVLGCFVFFRSESKQQTAYIEIAKVYDSFKMKKELGVKYDAVEMHRKKIIDSLELELKLLGNAYGEKQSEDIKKSYLKKKQDYLITKKQFEEDNAAVTQQYTGQIFEQLNTYITEYGKEHGYRYIFGADGNGALMYASDSENITTEITAYVNSKYKGTN